MATRQIKSTDYFSHDINARNDEKIERLRTKHGAAGYGVYFMVLERLGDEADYMGEKDYNMIAHELRVDAAIVKSVIEDFGLFTFTEDGKCFYSECFSKRMKKRDTLHRRRSEGGKKGMEKRWKKKRNNDGETESNPTKEEPATKQADTPQPATISCVSVNDTFLKQFFSKNNQSNLEVLLMNLGMKPYSIPILEKVAKEVVAEWDISKKQHYSYTDWSQHLISTMRIKIKDKAVIKEEEPPVPSEYQYNGGFGSKDI